MKKKHNLGNEAVYDARTLGLPRIVAAILFPKLSVFFDKKR